MKTNRNQILGMAMAVALMGSSVAGPMIDTADATWAEESSDTPEHFGGGEDHTTDPDEPFDGLDRSLVVKEDVKVEMAVKPQRESLLMRLIKFLRAFGVRG